MSTYGPVVDTFYGLSEVAEGVDDDNLNRWLGALVLLLAEEIGDRDRVVELARQAAQGVTTATTDEEEEQL
jgi:hypothetical protein